MLFSGRLFSRSRTRLSGFRPCLVPETFRRQDAVRRFSVVRAVPPVEPCQPVALPPLRARGGLERGGGTTVSRLPIGRAGSGPLRRAGRAVRPRLGRGVRSGG